MICSTCHTSTTHIRSHDGIESCTNCGGFSETSGNRVSNSLTRNATRIREQRSQYEGDMVQPHTYNKRTRKTDINPDFVDLYADKAGDYYSKDDMNKAGFTKLPEHTKSVKAKTEAAKDKARASVEFVGDSKRGIERHLTVN